MEILSATFSGLDVFLMLLVAAMSGALFLLVKRLSEEKKRNENFEARFTEMQVRMQSLEVESIKHKLNPHLFKNVLNSIQSHAYQTYHALEKLSEVLDYILYESDEQMVSARKEMDFAKNLIEINRLKLSPLFDLRVSIANNDTEPLATELLMAPMICAPVIENAFKHADIQSEDAFIAVRFGFDKGLLVLDVANSVSVTAPLRKMHSGIGESGLHKRLDAVYGKFYQLEKGLSDRIYRVCLKIDLNGYKNQMCADR